MQLKLKPYLVLIITTIGISFSYLLVNFNVNEIIAQIPSTSSQAYKVFSSETFGMAIKYPDNWQPDEPSGERNVETGQVGYDEFATFCPKENSSNDNYTRFYCFSNPLQVSVKVLFLPLNSPPKTTLENIVNSSVVINQYVLNNFTILSINETKFHGYETIEIIYSYRDEEKIENPNFELKMNEDYSFNEDYSNYYSEIKPYISQVVDKYFIKNNVLYQITFKAKQLEFEYYLPIYNVMMDSLKIQDMPKCILSIEQKKSLSSQCEL